MAQHRTRPHAQPGITEAAAKCFGMGIGQAVEAQQIPIAISGQRVAKGGEFGCGGAGAQQQRTRLTVAAQTSKTAQARLPFNQERQARRPVFAARGTEQAQAARLP